MLEEYVGIKAKHWRRRIGRRKTWENIIRANSENRRQIWTEIEALAKNTSLACFHHGFMLNKIRRHHQWFYWSFSLLLTTQTTACYSFQSFTFCLQFVTLFYSQVLFQISNSSYFGST